MKTVKKWLFPVLTLLMAAGAAALPPYISQARDAGQFGQLHAEVLEADALPVREPPTLLERLALYARWCTPSETIPSFHSPVVDGELPKPAAREALMRLAEAEVLPYDLVEESLLELMVTDMDCVLLWDPTDRMSNQEPVSIWSVSADLPCGYGSIGMDLDVESGLPLRLSIYNPDMARWLDYKNPDTLPDLARRYFDLLGLEAEQLESYSIWDGLFSILGVEGLCCRVSYDASMLNISLDSCTENISISADTDR